jgi:Flp pilus assembly protein TadD
MVVTNGGAGEHRHNRLTMPHTFHIAALALVVSLLSSSLRAETPSTQGKGMDAPLFYQLLVGELELQRGELGTAYQVLLDAARRTQSETLYKRSVDIALQARAGNEAYAAARAWREQVPSAAAQQHVVQLAVALGRLSEAAEPLVDWLAASDNAPQRAGMLGTLPQLLRNVEQRERPLNEMEPSLAGLRDSPQQSPLRRQLAAALIAQLAMHAGNETLAMNQLREAERELPGDALPGWLAIELMRLAPDAEPMARERLAGNLPLHLAYARALARDHRTQDSMREFQALQALEPSEPTHLYAIGSLNLDLHQPQLALTALEAYLAQPKISASTRRTAHLLVAQAQSSLRNWPAALTALEQAAEGPNDADVAFRRALIEAQQGQLTKARQRLQDLPADKPEERERRLLMEVQLLREAAQWSQAFELLGKALKEEPNDVDLLYEHAMSAERLGQFELMETQLRRVIEINPRHHHAHNALGYSLAERNIRLVEARTLIERAIELGGHEPFLVDSLGWVAYREGRLDDAERLLRQAHRARPDAEIAAHLAETLWKQGKADEARDLIAQAQTREPESAVLKATRKRLGL